MKKEPPGSPRICVAYNSDFLPGGSAANTEGQEAGQESADVAERVANVLGHAGFCVDMMALDSELPSTKIQGLVFNLVESLGGDPAREPEFVRWMEAIGQPFTGNSSAALEIAHAKHIARRVLTQSDIRIPEGLVFGGPGFDLPLLASLEFPVFLKPALYDGSVGIDQASVVYDAHALRERLDWLITHVPGPYLAETYLPGREFNVAVGPASLGRFAAVTEIDFSSFTRDLAPIVTYACKWIEDSPEAGAHSKPMSRMTNLSLYDELVRLSRGALDAIGANAYGRVDLRLSADGLPHVIDVNPNPDIHPDAGFGIATRSAGFSVDELYLGIVQDALRSANSLEVTPW